MSVQCQQRTYADWSSRASISRRNKAKSILTGSVYLTHAAVPAVAAQAPNMQSAAALLDHPLPFSVIKSKFRVALTDRFGILLCTSDGREVP